MPGSSFNGTGTSYFKMVFLSYDRQNVCGTHIYEKFQTLGKYYSPNLRVKYILFHTIMIYFTEISVFKSCCVGGPEESS